MSFPKKGKPFPLDQNTDETRIDDLSFAMVISLALKRSIGNSHRSIKTAAKWTGANERTVKNWFKGKYGPSGEHLMSLAHHCDEVMEALILLAGRETLLVAVSLNDIEGRLENALELIRQMPKKTPD
ncbi:hypothetical protein [Phyllobacterium sp. 22552]|uniref:hypothetical protein n=1 Tax=Phyllobacterium sp. 22552 TaxID=3453941 RepID=UPI003F87F06B